MTSCPVCFEDNEEQMVALKDCSHEICHPCLKQWFEACERTGQGLPTCPKCRVCIQEDEVAGILGRIFTPAGASGVAQETVETDELTQQLLSETARACGNCGVWIVKEDGCDMMQCVCGYRFCFGCGMAGGRDCDCTPATHVFYDNVVEQNATRAPVHVATMEELDELRLYLEHTKFKGLMKNVLTELITCRVGDRCLHCSNRIRSLPLFYAFGFTGGRRPRLPISNNCTCGHLTFLDNVALHGNLDEHESIGMVSVAEELRNLRCFLRVRQAKSDLLREIKVECRRRLRSRLRPKEQTADSKHK